MKYFFTKMSGAGNDFILFDKKLNPKIELTSELISHFCNRRTGIGADGILIIEAAHNSNFEMKYFNSDGSTGSLCANGARCSLLYAWLNGYSAAKNLDFIFEGKSYSGEILNDGNIKFNLLSPTNLKLNFKIKAKEQLINASYANTGAPHVVIKIDDVLKNPKDLKSFHNSINDFPVYELGKEIRDHKDFRPNGTNVNFVLVEKDSVLIRTFERGVEDETLSCGTGTVASAVTLFKNGFVQPPVKFLARSGDQLVVDFNFDGNGFENVSLTGPAKIVFNGEITI